MDHTHVCCKKQNPQPAACESRSRKGAPKQNAEREKKRSNPVEQYISTQSEHNAVLTTPAHDDAIRFIILLRTISLGHGRRNLYAEPSSMAPRVFKNQAMTRGRPVGHPVLRLMFQDETYLSAPVNPHQLVPPLRKRCSWRVLGRKEISPLTGGCLG